MTAARSVTSAESSAVSVEASDAVTAVGSAIVTGSVYVPGCELSSFAGVPDAGYEMSCGGALNETVGSFRDVTVILFSAAAELHSVTLAVHRHDEAVAVGYPQSTQPDCN